MSRTRSIRPKSDPDKPCNRAHREGREAKRRGLPLSACPYDRSDTYSRYLREHWLSGYDPLQNAREAAGYE